MKYFVSESKILLLFIQNFQSLMSLNWLSWQISEIIFTYRSSFVSPCSHCDGLGWMELSLTSFLFLFDTNKVNKSDFYSSTRTIEQRETCLQSIQEAKS